MQSYSVRPVQQNALLGSLLGGNRNGGFEAWASQNHPTWRQDPAEEQIARDEYQQMQGGMQQQVPQGMPQSPMAQQPQMAAANQPGQNAHGDGKPPPWAGGAIGGLLGGSLGGSPLNILAGGLLGGGLQKLLKSHPEFAGGALPGFLSKLF